MAAAAAESPQAGPAQAPAKPAEVEEEERPDPMMLGEKYIPGLEYIQDEFGKLTEEQLKEQTKIIETIDAEYKKQLDEQNNKAIMRLRKQFIHLHGTIGGERTQEAVIAMKAKQMVENGMTVYVLNINFLKRLATRALFFFIKDNLFLNQDNHEPAERIHLKIQEEDADEEDREELVDDFLDLSEDYPLFVITDETCQEPERLDPVMPELLTEDSRFHFWSSSAYAHGTPDISRRYRMSTHYNCPPPIKLVMDMIDIDDDDVDITGPHHVPLRRIVWPDEGIPKGNVMDYLEKLPVKMISHRYHEALDVWECEDCGKLLAEYLLEDLQLEKPGGPTYKDIFIVGSFRRFEKFVSISGLQVALLEHEIESEVLFCRRTVKPEDVLKTMNRVVLSDSVSVRGIDKAVVVVIPTPDARNILPDSPPPTPPSYSRKKRRMTKSKPKSAYSPKVAPSGFVKPTPKGPDDEIILYQRQRRSGETEEDEDGASGQQTTADEEDTMETGEADDEDCDDDDFDDFEFVTRQHRKTPRSQRPRMSPSSHHSLLRRCVNSLSRADKDMILDLFTDAPKHAVLFHFAEDDFQFEPWDF